MLNVRRLRGAATTGTIALGLFAGGAAAQQQAAEIPAALQNYKPVTAERLKDPDPGDWLTIRRTYDGWAYSPLDEIDVDNVAGLRPVWVYSTGVNEGHQAPPIVNDGVMFVATPENQVIALEAATGNRLWTYRRSLQPGAIVLHRTSRGVGLYDDKVFFAAGDAVLVALDARTGQEIWTAEVDDNSQGYYMTVAPLVADGKVLVGMSGGELGIRGYVAAYDAETGEEAWRSYMIPAPGEPGSETWPDGDEWMTGGGATWMTGNYDSETNLVYWGTGNGGPWMGDQRPGDNLYVTSTVAIDAASGEIKGHFQYVPNDSWDWDEVSPPILIDYERDGESIRGLVNVARNGYIYFLERGEDGPIGFVDGKPYVVQDVFFGLDPETGRADVDPARKPGTGVYAEHCPSLWGGKNWPPGAFNPHTRMLYVPVNNNLCGAMEGREVDYQPGGPFTGASGISVFAVEGAEHFGEVQAWNVDTGELAWMHPFERSANWGPMLTTAGGLVFSGGTNDRKFRAFDAQNGEVLWEFPTNSGIIGMPTSFEADGRQYVAVQSGFGVDARGMQGRLNAMFPGEFPPVPEGGAIWVFALP